MLYKCCGFTDVSVCICKITTGKCQMLDLLGWGMTCRVDPFFKAYYAHLLF